MPRPVTPTCSSAGSRSLLHTRFEGLYEFVAELVLDRLDRCVRRAAQLPGLVGHSTVAARLQGPANAPGGGVT
ncbi:hypothetical protein N4G70_08020 [Streptomyces sp. ASQP_92]|uniref:hypothetical protein n=1 Tax=Streptomyces sp. ASQP_92 TaxID=2979116 RepID=UPI0021BF15B6|nr:hypothetical protein [Streptomyces sp. ASQP_92]MCT9088812.1 hypothetical protein [Streptomyces sp. ASQP_92]